jgi:hypothetical protein
LVIRYSFLWHSEQLKGREEGIKDRPCAIILVTADAADREIVTVLPVTHSPPSDLSLALEIPGMTKARLGLDAERSWVVLNEANRFVWPGPDLRYAVSGDSSSVAYGVVSEHFYEEMRKRFVDVLKSRRAKIVMRDAWKKRPALLRGPLSLKPQPSSAIAPAAVEAVAVAPVAVAVPPAVAAVEDADARAADHDRAAAAGIRVVVAVVTVRAADAHADHDAGVGRGGRSQRGEGDAAGEGGLGDDALQCAHGKRSLFQSTNAILE